MPPPLAYFLTWTCYGTRLHGDERGSVDRAHNKVGTPFPASDPARESGNRNAMAWAPYVLSSDARTVVDRVVRDHCTIRKWALIELNVRATHVHVIVDCHDRIAPDPAMEQFKAYGTRRLRETQLAGADQPVWTEGGSTRWLNTERSLADAINYVRNRQ